MYTNEAFCNLFVFDQLWFCTSKVLRLSMFLFCFLHSSFIQNQPQYCNFLLLNSSLLALNVKILHLKKRIVDRVIDIVFLSCFPSSYAVKQTQQK